MNKLIFCLAMIMSAQLKAQSPELVKFYNTALSAYNEKDYSKFYENISEAGKLHPYHQGILYLRAKAAALTGKNDEAIACLKKAIEINAPYPLEGVPDFNSIKDTKPFHVLIEEQKELKKVVVHSDTAFTIHDRALHSEGIAYDPEQKLFYIGSIHKRKVVTVNSSGKVNDFCPSGWNGMTSVFGLKVDVERELLWVCSSPMDEMDVADSTLRSAVFKFDLLSGRLLQKFEVPDHKRDRVFGDLILSKNGTVYISDSKNNEIYTVNEGEKRLDIFYSSPEFWNMQGMAFSANEKILFISDYIKGVFKLALDKKKLTLLPAPIGYSMKGIDGLYYYKNSLIAIQNGVTPQRASRYYMNGSMTGFNKVEIIDRAHPAFNEPTLGVLNKTTFYYIANSQWGGYDDQHHIKPDDQLQDIAILKYKLDRP